MKLYSTFLHSDDWFGILQSWADSKKKSNLVLSIFEPAIKLSWLGELTQLGPSIDEDTNPYVAVNEDEEESPFPVALPGYFSYHHQGFLAWTKNSLQVREFEASYFIISG